MDTYLKAAGNSRKNKNKKDKNFETIWPSYIAPEGILYKKKIYSGDQLLLDIVNAQRRRTKQMFGPNWDWNKIPTIKKGQVSLSRYVIEEREHSNESNEWDDPMDFWINL